MNKNRLFLILGTLLFLPIPLLLFVGFFLFLIVGTSHSVSLSLNQTQAVESTAGAVVVQQRGTSIASQVRQNATGTVQAGSTATVAFAATQTARTNGVVSFSQDVLPIFQSRCVYCHGPNSIAGAPPNGLQLDSYENVMLGSLFLPVVNPGAPDGSTIILLLRSGGMPAQSTPLPADQIELIADWIAAGAADN